VARAICDPDNIDAEFGVIVRSELKGAGLGELLMNKLIRTLRAQGTQFIVGSVLGENERMRELARDLGFTDTPVPGEPGVRSVRLAL
jgi:acetyltransferase